ncbi:MAG: ATP-binding SpoIIE family protein phosphatase [Fimbriimonas sp.]
MKILVADDDDVSALVLSDRLEELGYDVTVVENGVVAWECVQTGAFRLLILDWMMPEMDGMELVRRVRENPSAAYTYIILLTGRTDRKDRLEALSGGVDDFLPKPLDQGELIARLKAADRILKSEEALRDTNEALKHLRRSELRTGGYIQQRLLQSPAPSRTPGFEVASLNIPSQEVDGDFVDFYTFGEDVLDVVAADVMGKGVPAALTGAGVKTSLNRALIHMLGPGHDGLPEPKALMERLDEAVAPELIELQSFLTLCYARFDRGRGTLRYVNCGHPRLIHWNARDCTCSLLPTTAMPIGFTDDAVYEQQEVTLGAGDLVLLYSDGITDLPTDSGGRLGMNGFAEWVGPRGAETPERIIADLRGLRESAPGPLSARDDFSCVAVRFVGPTESGSGLSLWAIAETLDRVRQHVVSAAERSALAFNRRELGEIQLAVQEAASNAVRHARAPQFGIPIQVRTETTEGYFRVELRYPGIPFDPTSVPPPTLDGTRDGGFGVAIIHQCMDKVTYLDEAGQNLLVLEKLPAGRSEAGRNEAEGETI